MTFIRFSSSTRILGITLAALPIAAALVACSSEDPTSGGTDGGADASTTSDATTTKDGSTGTDAAKDTSTANDGGSDAGDSATPDGGTGVNYTVPASGGSAMVPSKSGNMLTFTFPASAAGKNVTLTPVDPTTIGWAADQLQDVIKLEPDGTTFTDPVIIKSSSKNVLVAKFPSTASKSPATFLELDSSGTGFKLTGFSTLAFIPPGKSCDSSSGWKYTPEMDGQKCANQGAFSKYVEFGCKGYSFCTLITAGCCEQPSTVPDAGGAGTTAPACTTDDKALSIRFQRTDSNGGQYPYCSLDAGTDAGDSSAPTDAGSDASSSACGTWTCTTGTSDSGMPTCNCTSTAQWSVNCGGNIGQQCECKNPQNQFNNDGQFAGCEAATAESLCGQCANP